MKATNGPLSTRQPTSLPVHANVFSGSAIIRPFQYTRSIGRWNSLYSTALPFRRSQVATGQHSRPSRVVCSASHSQHKSLSDAPSGEYCGVTLTTAVYEIVECATKDRKVLNGDTNIAGAVSLLLAGLRHRACSNLVQRMEASGVYIDEVEAVLTVGLAVQEGTNACTGSSSSATPKDQQQDVTSGFMQRIVYSAMQYAASKGSNVVQVKDVLCCLSGNRDAVCLTSNPIYYAYNQMFGPFKADKMMDEWLELLSTTVIEPDTKDCLLPAHITSAADRLTRKAVHEAKSAAGIADLLTAYTELRWVPSVSVSTRIWELLSKTPNVCLDDRDVADRLLAGLATLPLPPTVRNIRKEIASVLDKLIMRLCSSSMYTLPSFSTVGWKLVFNTLCCCARLEEAFPGTIAEYQLSGGNTAVNEVRKQATGGLCDKIQEVSLGNFPYQEAYIALTYLKCLQRLSEAPTSSSLLHPAHDYSNATARAAFLSSMLALQQQCNMEPWHKCIQKHMYTDLQEQAVASRLPSSVWTTALEWQMETTDPAVSSTAQVLTAVYRHLGWIWPGSSAELLIARMKALKKLKQNGDHSYLGTPHKQWLWEDVVSTLARTRNANAIKTLLDYAKALELPIDATSERTSRVLQQALDNVELDQSDLTSYLSTLPEYARSAAKQQRLASSASSDTPSMMVQETVPLAAVHSHVAGYMNARRAKGRSAATGGAGKQDTSGVHAQDVLVRLSSDKDGKIAMQLALEAVQNNQIPRLLAITWLCMKFNTVAMTKTSMEQLSEQLEAAHNMLVVQQSSNGNQNNTPPAVLRQWAATAKQHLSLAVQQLSSGWDLAAVPKLTTAMITLIRLGQTNVWLSDLPCRILTGICGQSFNHESKLLWARFVWCLSAAWWLDPSLTTMKTCDAQLTCLKDVLATAGDNQPIVQTSLMMTAAACSFQEQLTKTDITLPPIINQLFLATSNAAILNVAKLDTSKLKEATDTELLYLSAMVVRLCYGQLPSEISRDKLNVGLRVLSNEMERRQHTAPVPAAPAKSFVGRQVEVLINPRAPHPVTAFLDFTPEGLVFRAEIVKYIADADKYEVRFWPDPEGLEKYQQVSTDTVLDNLVPKDRELSREELRTSSTTATPAMAFRYNSVHTSKKAKPVTATNQWAAVARAIKAKL